MCGYCSSSSERAEPVRVLARGGEAASDETIVIPRCRRCVAVHEAESGLGAVGAGLLGAVVAGFLFARGINPRAGFGAALLRAIPFAGVFVALAAAGGVLGWALSRPRLWGSRPQEAWRDHPDVARARERGLRVERLVPQSDFGVST